MKYAVSPFKAHPAVLTCLGVLLLAFAALEVGRADAEKRTRAEELNMGAFPQKVQDAVDRAARVYEQPLNGARWSKVYQMPDTDHPLYQLQGTNRRGNKVEMEVTSAGRILEVEEHGIPQSEVPRAVTEALKAKMPRFEPTRVEAIYQNEQPQPVSYGFEGADAAGKSIEVYISADGKTFLN